jgi:hypothetical protein
MAEAYQALCELWASREYQEKSEKKWKLGAAFGNTCLRLIDTPVWVNEW